ncbi:tail fiber domain-containing protein [Pseudomonas monteilii]|uniref:tail fiber domain-containing protein n=1 Tax=Pseudomonas monteilii TaxID=76759 RepID=UPI00076104D7|nr:tail fiber domain-containing protein [Pseudomonas monteilii]
MADQTQRLEIATVRAEVGSNILFHFANDAENADGIPTQSGDIKNLKQVVLEIQQDAAEKISISTTIYPSVAAGLAATADQGIFLVQSNDADEIYTVWQNQGGTAVNTGKTALSATAIQTALDASNEAARAAEDAADVATARTARYLAPSATQPTVRDNGLPLEIGDVWFDTVEQTEYRYTDQGWRANESQQAILDLESQISLYPEPNAIPRAGSDGKLPSSWLPDDIARKESLDRLEAKLSEIVTVYDADGDAQAAAELAFNKTYIVPEYLAVVVQVPLHFPTINLAMDAISQWLIPKSSLVKIRLAEGVYSYDKPTDLSHRDAARVRLEGADLPKKKITGIVSIAGSAKDYRVTYSVDSDGIKVGDWVDIEADIVGSGDFYPHGGTWKVTAVSNGRFTVRNTNHISSFKDSTITSGNLGIYKTVIEYSGCDGLRAAGESFGLVEKIAFIGDYDVATGLGTVGAHGCLLAGPPIVGGASSNLPFQIDAGITFGRYVAFCNWGEHGLAASMRSSFLANYSSFCSNRKRGAYAEGAHGRLKLAKCSGNGEDGAISDTSGFLQLALTWMCGNGLNGGWSTNGSSLSMDRGVATSNLGCGVEQRGSGRCALSQALMMNNLLDGAFCNASGSMHSLSATFMLNGRDGLRSETGASIIANNSNISNNSGYGAHAISAHICVPGATVVGNTSGPYLSEYDSYIVRSDNTVEPTSRAQSTNIGLVHPASHAGFRAAASSIGDMTWLSDTSGGGAYTGRYVWKADGTFHPASDNTQDLARAANRFKNIYAGTGTIQTSDERLKCDISRISDKVLNAWMRVDFFQYKYKDAVFQKGENARTHFGVIAQKVKDAFESEGLDPFAFGILCHDSWGKVEAVLDDDGNILQPDLEPGDRYSIRYEEALILESALMRRAISGLFEKI